MIKTLRIDRKKWGTGYEGGTLLNEVGKMCCLGFYCLKAGYKAKDIIYESMPYLIDSSDKLRKGDLKKLVSKDSYGNSVLAAKLAMVNDSDSPYYVKNPKRRENQIKKLFLKMGVKVTFYN